MGGVIPKGKKKKDEKDNLIDGKFIKYYIYRI